MRAVVLGSSDDDAPVLVNQSRDRSVHPTSGAASMSFTLTYRCVDGLDGIGSLVGVGAGARAAGCCPLC